MLLLHRDILSRNVCSHSTFKAQKTMLKLSPIVRARPYVEQLRLTNIAADLKDPVSENYAAATDHRQSGFGNSGDDQFRRGYAEEDHHRYPVAANDIVL